MHILYFQAFSSAVKGTAHLLFGCGEGDRGEESGKADLDIIHNE